MQIHTSSFEKRVESDVLVVPFFKGKKGPENEISFPKNLKESIHYPIQAKDFTGKEGEIVWTYGNLVVEKRVILLGLGEKEKVTQEILRRVYGAALKSCSGKKLSNVSIYFPEGLILSQKQSLRAILEGVYFANYSYDVFKEPKEGSKIQKLEILECDPKVVKEETIFVEKVMGGVYLARDLINGNADDVTPYFLGETAKKIKKGSPRISVEVHDKKWIEKQGMNLLFAVGKGSQHPPYFIELKYKGNPTSKDHTVVVGKGVTFDTGGINLKPTGGVEYQRSDMSGAACALGIIKAVSGLELPVNVTAIIATCENAIDAASYKPGDVFRAYNGKSVEITNTDAEGRLTLADALSYSVKELDPTRIIDFATLTGAMVVALGQEVAGLMSNSDSLAEDLLKSSDRTFERAWRMPIYEEYKDTLKSDIADMKNAGSREGGAITAALFLKEFVGEVPWAHFDIAGVAFLKDSKRYLQKNATGYGVRLIVDFLEHLCEKEERLIKKRK